MADKFCTELIRIAVAQIAQNIGYSSSQIAPLELLQDILHKFIQEFARDLHSQSEHANRIEPSLKDAQLSLKGLSINIYELLDYIGNVEPVPFTRDVPLFPIKKDSSLNFLKPGSSETLTRPVHIYEYLPAMLRSESIISASTTCQTEQNIGSPSTATDVRVDESTSTFDYKKSSTSLVMHHGLSQQLTSKELTEAIADAAKRNISSDFIIAMNSSNKDLDIDAHGVREISSVVMTSGGFISPAIEGKLPEVFIPEIIEKFQGLDAPPLSEISQQFSTSTPNDQFLITETKLVQSTDIDSYKKKEIKIQSISLNHKMSSLKASKKSKKSLLKDYTDQIKNKSQEKAQRKAIKMYHKLTKSANVSGKFVSKKHINHMVMSSVSEGAVERFELEKLLKKHVKHRQKQLRMQKNVDSNNDDSNSKSVSLSICSNNANEMSITSESKKMSETIEKASITFGVDDSFVDSYQTLSESKNNLSSIVVNEKNKTVSTVNDEIKLTSEPDRNKLNIFKKISKQKMSKVLPPNAMNLSSGLYDNTSSGSPLISLPSGTTITPAPPALETEEVNRATTNCNTITAQDFSSFSENAFGLKSNSIPESTTLVLDDSNKPKKRGRKPGSKNQVKSGSLIGMHPIKKSKDSKLSFRNDMEISQAIATNTILGVAMEPLNLSNLVQPHNPINDGSMTNVTISEKFRPKRKEKREKKKYKSKGNTFKSLNDGNGLHSNPSVTSDPNGQGQQFSMNNFMKPGFSSLVANKTNNDGNENTAYITSPTLPIKPSANIKKRVIQSSNVGNYIKPAGLLPSSAICQNDQSVLTPMLPLLQFPPRPGLIPSGPGLFPATSLSSFSNDAHRGISAQNLLLQSLLPFPGSGLHINRPILESQEDKSIGVSTVPVSDSKNYCNVAPLVSEPIKLTDGLCVPPLQEADISDFKMPEKAIAKFLPIPDKVVSANKKVILFDSFDMKNDRNNISSGTGDIGDPIEVSDDSDEPSVIKKQLPVQSPPSYNFLQSPTLKSNLVQPSQLLYALPQTSDMGHMKTIYTTTAEQKRCKKQAKSTKTNMLDVSSVSTPHPTLTTGPGPTPNSPFKINFIGNDKVSLAGGADLIPLSRIESGLAYSARTVPSTSLAVGATSGTGTNLPSTLVAALGDQQFLPNISTSGIYRDVTIIPTNSLLSTDLKVRNKEHKKLKKLKDTKIKKKKDKKDKSKNKERNEDQYIQRAYTLKTVEKKLKKDKKKDKQTPTNLPLQLNTKSFITESKVDYESPVDNTNPTLQNTMNLAHVSPNQIPKLTLKLSGKSTPLPEDNVQDPGSIAQSKRDQSPELARFSPLVTGPPKSKQNETLTMSIQSTATSIPPCNSTNTGITQTIPNVLPKVCTSTGWVSPATISASSVLLPQQLLQVVRPTGASPKGVSNCDVPALSSTVENTQIPESNRPSSYVDAEGNRIWICPACGKVDDGSAMIGCDGCDAWYHWVCVGIFVAPKDNEDWFCRVCITKKRVHGTDKKRKRNKKK